MNSVSNTNKKHIFSGNIFDDYAQISAQINGISEMTNNAFSNFTVLNNKNDSWFLLLLELWSIELKNLNSSRPKDSNSETRHQNYNNKSTFSYSNLQKLWILYSKSENLLPNGSRVSNILWRMCWEDLKKSKQNSLKLKTSAFANSIQKDLFLNNSNSSRKKAKNNTQNLTTTPNEKLYQTNQLPFTNPLTSNLSTFKPNQSFNWPHKEPVVSFDEGKASEQFHQILKLLESDEKYITTQTNSKTITNNLDNSLSLSHNNTNNINQLYKSINSSLLHPGATSANENFSVSNELSFSQKPSKTRNSKTVGNTQKFSGVFSNNNDSSTSLLSTNFNNSMMIDETNVISRSDSRSSTSNTNHSRKNIINESTNNKSMITNNNSNSSLQLLIKDLPILLMPSEGANNVSDKRKESNSNIAYIMGNINDKIEYIPFHPDNHKKQYQPDNKKTKPTSVDHNHNSSWDDNSLNFGDASYYLPGNAMMFSDHNFIRGSRSYNRSSILEALELANNAQNQSNQESNSFCSDNSSGSEKNLNENNMYNTDNIPQTDEVNRSNQSSITALTAALQLEGMLDSEEIPNAFYVDPTIAAAMSGSYFDDSGFTKFLRIQTDDQGGIANASNHANRASSNIADVFNTDFIKTNVWFNDHENNQRGSTDGFTQSNSATIENQPKNSPGLSYAKRDNYNNSRISNTGNGMSNNSYKSNNVSTFKTKATSSINDQSNSLVENTNNYHGQKPNANVFPNDDALDVYMPQFRQQYRSEDQFYADFGYSGISSTLLPISPTFQLDSRGDGMLLGTNNYSNPTAGNNTISNSAFDIIMSMNSQRNNNSNTDVSNNINNDLRSMIHLSSKNDNNESTPFYNQKQDEKTNNDLFKGLMTSTSLSVGENQESQGSYNDTSSQYTDDTSVRQFSTKSDSRIESSASYAEHRSSPGLVPRPSSKNSFLEYSTMNKTNDKSVYNNTCGSGTELNHGFNHGAEINNPNSGNDNNSKMLTLTQFNSIPNNGIRNDDYSYKPSSFLSPPNPKIQIRKDTNLSTSGGGGFESKNEDDSDNGPPNYKTLCSNCSAWKTPLWRRDPEGKPLCNACGLFFKLHGVTRPLSLKTNVIKKRNRGSVPGSVNSSSIPKKQKQISGGTKEPPQKSPHMVGIGPTKLVVSGDNNASGTVTENKPSENKSDNNLDIKTNTKNNPDFSKNPYNEPFFSGANSNISADATKNEGSSSSTNYGKLSNAGSLFPVSGLKSIFMNIKNFNEDPNT
ncbi:hypothetical protein BB559_007229 [Furculomyces boomerangus]|uniref:GATA-type domain-containing protein n=2 Tax=Furculomyces boomerangus TaxID=61424 RepID=A0A2T9XY77_9FUNG|nr:hypothetical protein BB559_007229 [Furculomyces boomerangus]